LFCLLLPGISHLYFFFLKKNKAEEGLSNPAAAADVLERLLCVEPQCVEGLMRLAKLRLASADLGAARDLLTRALAQAPPPPPPRALEMLGTACAGLKLYREACTAFAAAVEKKRAFFRVCI